MTPQTLAEWAPPDGTQALIFDCDGTLADTMPIHYRAWRAMLDPHEILFPESKFYSLGGMPTSRIIRLLADEQGKAVIDIERMVLVKEDSFLEFIAEVEPIAAVVTIAARYRGAMPIAVASGGYRRIVERTLDAIGVRDWFGAVVCAEDTVHHKPEPDVFLEAARRLGVADPTKCVVFEDTDIGLEAARRAGMAAVDVRGHQK